MNRDAIEFANFSTDMPYQQILNNLSVAEGLKYEMNHVGKLTVMSIYEYPHYGKFNVLTVKMEDLYDDFNSTVNKITNFLNLEKVDLSQHDINNMPESVLLSDNHITNKERKKYTYKDMWTDEVYQEAENIYPVDLLTKLDYKK